jgi:tetratricopeptide (TPR) repeat protein
LGIALTVADKKLAVEHLGKAIALNPNYVAALHSRGALLHQMGEPAAALPDLEKTVKLEPDNARALDHLGQVYRELDRLPDSERALKRAAELNPHDGSILMHLGHTLRDAGKAEEAAVFLERLEKLGTVQKEQKQRGGLLDFLSLSPAQQEEQYIRNIRGAIEVSPKNAGFHVRLGRALYPNGQKDEALAAFRQALALNPPPEVLADAGTALLQFQEWDLAKEFFAKAVLEQPKYRLDLAIAMAHTDSPQAGLAELDRIPVADRQGDYWLARAQMLDAAGKREQAAEALNRGFRAAPTRPDLYFEAALFLLKHEQTPQAMQLLEQASKILPDEPELALLHAIVLELGGQTAEAEAKLAGIERRWPEWDRPWLVHGIIVSSHARPAEGRRLIENAIALGSDEPEGWFYLADSIYASAPEEIANAHSAVTKAIAKAPDDPYVNALAGRIELTQGNVEAAIKHLTRAIELLPNLSEAHNQLSRALSRAGRAEEARAEAEIVRKLAAEQRGAEPAPALQKSLFGIRAPR